MPDNLEGADEWWIYAPLKCAFYRSFHFYMEAKYYHASSDLNVFTLPDLMESEVINFRHSCKNK